MPRPPFPNEHYYAVEQEILRHDDAVISYGEMTACVMLWNVEDFNAGMVTRCPTCYTANGDLAEAYRQSARKKCPTCYGTTFNGLRALLYRPALWEEQPVTQDIDRRGEMLQAAAQIQVVSGFTMREGDFLVRQDGTRWQITSPQDSEIVTGFGPTGANIVSGTFFRAQREDPSSVAFLVPINQTPLEYRGWSPYSFYPTQYDVINGDIKAGVNPDQFDGQPPFSGPGNLPPDSGTWTYLDGGEE